MMRTVGIEDAVFDHTRDKLILTPEHLSTLGVGDISTIGSESESSMRHYVNPHWDSSVQESQIAAQDDADLSDLVETWTLSRLLDEAYQTRMLNLDNQSVDDDKPGFRKTFVKASENIHVAIFHVLDSRCCSVFHVLGLLVLICKAG